MSSENTENNLNILTKAATRLKETVAEASHAVTDLFSVDSLSGFLISSFQEAISELREIDRIITQIGKIDRTLSKSDLTGIKTKALEISARYGVKSAEYLDEVLEATRAGYKNAGEIAELSTALQITAGISADAARSIITTTDSAYSLSGSVNELTRILNGLLTTAEKGAVNMEQLSESFASTAEQAAKLGISAYETAAATATLMNVSGMDAQAASDALTGLVSVISNSYQNCLNTGSTAADSFAAACQQLGVSLANTKNGITNLRDPIQIIMDLADACSQLSSSDLARANLLDALDTSGGSEDAADALNTLISSRVIYDEMLSDYSGNSANIMSEARKQLTSLDGALNSLSDTWTSTIANISNSDAAASVVNMANGMLGAVNGITSSLGPLMTIGAGTGITLFVKSFA